MLCGIDVFVGGKDRKNPSNSPVVIVMTTSNRLSGKKYLTLYYDVARAQKIPSRKN